MKRHSWEDDAETERGAGELERVRCVTCKVVRHTRPGHGQTYPIVEYLLPGLGWTTRRPECFEPQLDLFGETPSPRPTTLEGYTPPAAIADELQAEAAVAAVRVHACAVPGCEALIRTEFLMCLADWRLVPDDLQREVRAAWNGGRVASDYLVVRQRAVDVVVALRGIDAAKTNVSVVPASVWRGKR